MNMLSGVVEAKMSEETALADPRSVKVTLVALCTRMMAFANLHAGDESREKTVLHVLGFCSVLLKKHRVAARDENYSDLELVELSEDEIKAERKRKHRSMQLELVQAGALEVVVVAFSGGSSLSVRNAAMELGEELVSESNKEAQDAFTECLGRIDKDGKFFLASRDWIRSSSKALADYRETLMFNEARAIQMMEQVEKVVKLFDFLKVRSPRRDARPRESLLPRPPLPLLPHPIPPPPPNPPPLSPPARRAGVLRGAHARRAEHAQGADGEPQDVQHH